MNRFVPLILHVLKIIAERVDMGLPIMVFRDLSMRKHVVSRAILLIAFAMATATVIMGFPVNILHHDERVRYYNVGADFVIHGPQDASIKQSIVDNLNDFDVRITEWQRVTVTTPLRVEGKSLMMLTILGINSSTFNEAAYFEASYGLPRLGLEGALAQLQENPLNTALVSTQSKDVFELSIPESLKFKTGNPDPFNNTNITIVDEFSFWPRLIDFQRSPYSTPDYYYDDVYDPGSGSKELVLVMDLRFLQVIVNESSSDLYAIENQGYYLKVNGDDHVKDEVAYRLSTLGLSFQAVHSSLMTRNSTSARLFFTLHNAFLVVVVAVISAVVLLLALIYQRERWKDMGVERTLGMSKKQLNAYNILATVAISGIGTTIGVSLGLLLLGLLMTLFSVVLFSTSIPPFETIMPFSELFIVLGITAVFIALGSLLAVYMSSKRSISNILKVE